MLNFWWDSCSKWLYFGTKNRQTNQFTVQLDNWFWFHKELRMREWTLFQVMWDNGSWWWS